MSAKKTLRVVVVPYRLRHCPLITRSLWVQRIEPIVVSVFAFEMSIPADGMEG